MYDRVFICYMNARVSFVFGSLCFRLISMLFWDKDKDAMLYA